MKIAVSHKAKDLSCWEILHVYFLLSAEFFSKLSFSINSFESQTTWIQISPDVSFTIIK